MLNNFPITIKNSPNKDRGVFALEDIKKDQIIEIAPILVLKFEDFVDTKWNLLFEYYFWLDHEVVLALGYGSLYNHDDNPNASYKVDIKKRVITFTALKDIKKDEEIFFNYRGDKDSKTKLWFERNK